MHNIYYKFIAAAIIFVSLSCNNKIAYKGGVYSGETEEDVPSGYGIWTKQKGNIEYRGYWKNGKENGQGALKTPYTYYLGGFSKGKFSGYGQLTIKDSLVYSGQWKDGKRQGKGLCKDSLGRQIIGLWNADTLISGTRKDSLGTYIGRLNRHGIAEGHGVYITSDGKMYEGHWKDDSRDGFGFTIAAHHQMRVGEWSKDRYKGERVVYTTERIYGIDISKYQHIIGRRKYPILWNRVRISHLGTISQKNVSGNVDYPISFVYIKSTEGISVRNRYYTSDYHNARAQGIYVGSYHFFSTITSPTLQANFFLNCSHFRSGDFPPVLDVEPMPSQIKKMGGTGVMFDRIRTWMNIVHRRTGVRPILYVSQTFVNRYLSLAPDIKKNYNVWIARYGEYKPDVRLVYWQLCPDGRVRGIRGFVDINVFNGYRSQFDEFKETQTIR